WFVWAPVEGHALAVRAERHRAGAHVDGEDSFRVATLHGDGKDLRARELVRGIVDTLRGEEDAAAVFGPEDAPFGQGTAGELTGLDGFIGALRGGEPPDVRRVRGVEIAAAVDAVNGARDDTNVALALGRDGFRVFFRLRFSFFLGLAGLLGQIFGRSRA